MSSERKEASLEGMVAPQTAADSGPPTFPGRIGPYELLERLGAGGMGEVWLAEQKQPIRRRVAVKIIKAGMDTVEVVARFMSERQALAMMEHPAIAKVLDAGSTPEGRPYFVMEYVDGLPIDRHCDERRLSITERISLFSEVCDGVQHAHQKGVIHRDLKPSNILVTVVDGRAQPKIIDFGIAKAIGTRLADGTLLTELFGLVGTPEYMSPEQANFASENVDTRSDVYSLGVVCYELLTGELPFSSSELRSGAYDEIRRKIRETEPIRPSTQVERLGPGAETSARARGTDPGALRRQLKGDLDAITLKALEKEPEGRYGAASELASDLARYLAHKPVRARLPSRGYRLRKYLRRHRVGVAVDSALILLLLFFAAAMGLEARLLRARHDERWLQAEIIPELRRLADSDQLTAAQLLAMKTDAELPGNQALRDVWHSFTEAATISSEPAGARVSFRDYRSADRGWHLLGTTPFTIRLPKGFSRMRFELEGHRTVEIAANPYWSFRRPILLDRLDAHGDDLLHVPGGRFGPEDGTGALELKDFLLDKYEVTNRRYKAFVDAGGYERREFWRHSFVKDGQTVAWEQAIALFKDRTGRPGPSSWELGSYPPGQDSYPVGGLSWYEAAAFAAFAGRDLPTLYHWKQAAGIPAAQWIIPASNFAETGPSPVGSHQGLSPSGALDMAGNVREWCFNEGTGGRIIAGGGWNDPSYAFLDDQAVQSPWDRSPTNGVRLVTFLKPERNLERAREPVFKTVRDYSKIEPAGEAEFRIYRRMYDYDRRPLHEVRQTKETGMEWVRERVTFDAAYPGARVTAYLFLPRGSRPPYQTIIYFPGVGATELKSIDDDHSFWDFIIRSGRALMFPIYRGTFERKKEIDDKPWPPEESVAYRNAVIQWTQDLRRSIDYLETREEIDRERLGYFGFSWGGRLGGLIPAVEARLKVSVLHVAGLRRGPLPEADPFNFLPRVKIPTLMLNGRYDVAYPFESSQLPMFQALGTPPSLKRRVTYEAGHFVPRDQLIKETLDWYDRYLGPVSAPSLRSGSEANGTSLR